MKNLGPVTWLDDPNNAKRSSSRVSRSASIPVLPGIIEMPDTSPRFPAVVNPHDRYAKGFANVLDSQLLETDIRVMGSDQRDMYRMGRKIELRRNFTIHSALGFSILLSSSWMFALVTGTYTLTDGGLAGTCWMFVFTAVGMFTIMLSLAEMASITPSSGAQYHWTSEFAPQSCHKFLSFTVGWTCLLGWTGAMILACYIGGQQVESLILLFHNDWVPQPWHASCLTIGFMLCAFVINIFLIRKLPLLEGLALALYIAMFLFVLVVLWVMGERRSAEDVFTEFENDNDWSSMFLACLVTIGSPVVTLIGSDSTCHLAEEMRNARWAVPRAMLYTALVTYSTGFLMQITFLFNLGDIEAATMSVYGQSFVTVLLSATGSVPVTAFCVGTMCGLMIMCTVNQTTTAGRMVYAFARDNGLPLSGWLCKVRPGWDFPFNAMLATMIIATLVSLATIPSTNAFNVINTLTVGGLLWSYMIAIAVVLWRKITAPGTIPIGKFFLGRTLGLCINICAVMFALVAITFSGFPTVAHADLGTMNWSVLAWGASAAGFMLFYYFYARKHYTSPVERTRKET